MTLLGIIASSRATAAPVTTGITGFWDAGNAASYTGTSTWTDLSPAGNNFALSATTSGGSGNQTYVVFNGTNAHGSMAASVIPNRSTTSLTVSVWVYTTAATQMEWISNWSTNNGQNFFMGLRNYSSGDTLASLMIEDGYSVGLVSVGLNNWVNWVIVNDISGNNAYVYRNNVLIATKGSDLDTTNVTSLYIGRQGVLDAEYFTGRMAVIQTYSRALSTGELTQNWDFFRGRYGL